VIAKATGNCIESLVAKGIDASDIVVQTFIVVLNVVHLRSPKFDCARQADIWNLYSED